MLHKQDPNDLKPCPHMRTLVSAWMDGKLGGLMRWYTERHVAQCAQCQSSLPFLRALRARLTTLNAPQSAPPPEGLPEERWAKVEAAWEETDKALSPAKRE